ncbi:hypothetical protein [Aridibaculum aurantiacum]|uniref:hypothetical protein n=1 Tax=Aridibaculum aurantiacum TaxID=2810307 RepID=UPI001A960C27|nr:hypothetical protein [Aridibaculum aurantiacum]
MKKISIIIATFLTLQAAAQKTTSSTWEIEIDPLAYAFFKGYSGHVSYNTKNMKYDAGFYGLEVPPSVHGNEGFTEKVKGFGFKTSYLLGNVKGLYTGLGVGYTTTEARHQATSTIATGNSVGVGAHLGYRLFLQKEKDGTRKGLYIAPWVSVDYNMHLQKVKFENMHYKQSNWGFFPTVHIGYRF